MANPERILEDSQLIRMLFHRLQVAGQKVRLEAQERGDLCQVLGQDAEGLLLRLDPLAFPEGEVQAGAKVTLKLEDRGLQYETVTVSSGTRPLEGMPCLALAWPRTLRRTDAHRVTEFIPDRPARATVSNARNKLLEGHVKGFGNEGVELALDDPSADMQGLMRIGEESMLDIALEQDLRLVAPTKVAYFGKAMVGLTFTERTDQFLLGRYQEWLAGKQVQQAEQDRESYEVVRRKEGQSGHLTLPPPRLLVDRDPLILVLTEKDEFARHMAEAFGRKYGFLALDYFTGAVRDHVKTFAGSGADWGRVRLVLVHNQLRLSSPLELTRNLVEKEKCPLPILMVGTEEDAELKRNRAIGAGAVDYQPVEPFKVLSVLRKLDEILAMFA